MSLILTGIVAGSVLTVTAAGTVMAGETQTEAEDDGSLTGLLSSLLGDASLGDLADSVSEYSDELNSDLDSFLESFKEKYGDVDAESLETLLSGALAEAGIDLDALNLEDLDLEALLSDDNALSEFLEEHADSIDGLAALLPAFAFTNTSDNTNADPMDAVDDYLNDFAATFDPADVTLPVKLIVNGGADLDNGTFFTFGDFWVFNYNVESDQLVFASGGEQAAMITSIPQDDGSYAYEADEAADGEDYKDEIARLCAETGSDVTVTEFFSATDEETRDILLLEAFIAYVDENPEITSIEMNGEMITVDEAKSIISEYYVSIFEETEALTE